MRCLFLTHPEVVVDPTVPVTHWVLSDLGRTRAQACARWIADQGWELVVASREQKAVETAELLSAALDLPLTMDERLGENDRSATGFLPPAEFEQVADSFFAHPDDSIRGWETATAARERIVGAVRRFCAAHRRRTVFVAHGAVGSLLLSDLLESPITRALDQPRQGCWFAFDATAWTVEDAWQVLPEPGRRLDAHELGRTSGEGRSSSRPLPAGRGAVPG